MKAKRLIASVIVLLGLTAYLILFFATRLPSIEATTGGIWRRIDFFSQLLLLPETLVESWFGSPPDVAFADRVPVLAIAMGILTCATAVGWLLLAACGIDRRLGRLETLVFSAAAGLNVLSTYMLLVGLLGWLSSRLVLVLPVAVAVVAAVRWRIGRAKRNGSHSADAARNSAHGSGNRDQSSPLRAPCEAWSAGEGQGVRGRRHSLRVSKKRHHTDAASSTSRATDDAANSDLGTAWLWLAVPFALIVILGAMLPPVDFDVREYHLQAPKEFYQQGRIDFVPHNVYANMPLGTEMLSLLAMVAAGDWWLGALAGKTVLAGFTLLATLGLVAAGQRFFSTTAGVVAAVVFVSIPWMVQVSTSGLVEGASACYLLLAVYAMLLWRQTNQESPEDSSAAAGRLPDSSSKSAPTARLACVPGSGTAYVGLAGYLAGGAVSCKYPAVLFVVIPLIVWLVMAHLPLPWRTAWRPLGVFLLATAVGCGLWFGKNWALAGNPTYPLLSAVFDGKTRTAEKDRQWNQVHRPETFSVAALASDVARVGLTSEWLSPIVMPLAAMGLLVAWRRRTARILLLWFVYTIAAWWLFTHRIDRFWIPVLPLAALLAGLGACWTPERWCRKALLDLPLAGLALAIVARMGLAGLPFALVLILAAILAWRLPERLWLVPLLVIGLGWNLLAATAGGGGYNRYFVSLARLRSDPEYLDPWHRYFNARVRQGCVLTVGDAQVFDLEVPVLYNTCFDDSVFVQLVEGKTTGQIHTALAEKGIRYVFVHWGEIRRYRETGYGFPEFVQPAVFDMLVEQGVLQALPPIDGHSGRAYRVLQPP